MKDVAHFIVKKGCKNIAFISADILLSPSSKRFQDLCDGLKENGIEFDKTLLYTDSFSVETGYNGALYLF